jgi:hypothetical protein
MEPKSDSASATSEILQKPDVQSSIFGSGSNISSFSQLKSSTTAPFWQNCDSKGEEKPSEKPAEQESIDSESKLSPVTIQTGEENENTIFSRKSKLYFTSKNSVEWAEKGCGLVKVNENASGGRRLSMITNV